MESTTKPGTTVDLMAQMFAPGWVEETLRVEAGCDITAGPDLGANAGAYLNFVSNYGSGIDPDKLKDFLRQELLRFPFFDEEDVEAIAAAALKKAADRLQRKFVPQKQPATSISTESTSKTEHQ